MQIVGCVEELTHGEVVNRVRIVIISKENVSGSEHKPWPR